MVSPLTIYIIMLQFTKDTIGGLKMANITFQFDRTKAIEVLLYLAQKVSVPNVYGICKMLYLADKASLEKYGRFLFGDSYVAMKEGGTPSNVYDLLKRLRREPTTELKVDGNLVIALRQADLDHLSESDIECLNQTIDKYGKPANWSDRKRACHDDAWQMAWNRRGISGSTPITVESIAELFDDSEDLLNYLSNADTG